LFAISQERFDLFEGQGRKVRLVEPVDGDAVIFDTIPPELGLSAWGDFPIVGHGGGSKETNIMTSPMRYRHSFLQGLHGGV